MQIEEAIELALPVFVAHEGSDEANLEMALLQTGMPRFMAYLASELMPLAFGRLLLADMRVATCDEFVRYIIENGEVIEQARKKLKDEPFYVKAMEVARAKKGHSFFVKAATRWREGQKNMNSQFAAVAGRSAELKAVMELVSQGSKPENIVLTVPHLQFRQ